jgi:hypothetical protein
LSRRVFRRKNQNHYGAQNSGDFYHPFQIADAPHAPALRARRKRPRDRRAAKHRDEIAPSHAGLHWYFSQSVAIFPPPHERLRYRA